VSLVDLSVWCHTCDSYVVSSMLYPILNKIHILKHGVELPRTDFEIDYDEVEDEVEDEKEKPEEFQDMLNKFMNMFVHQKKEIQLVKTKILPSPTLEGVAEAIRTGICKNIIVLSGAGISVAAGIPDFRTPGTGLYDNLEKYKLPFPEAIFEINYFKENPNPFFCFS